MYGIDPETCRWSRSFLCYKTQHVIADREASKKVEITSRVPQGSIQGPIFFLIYINDMEEYIKHSSVTLFGDDSIIYLTITAENEEDLKVLERWEADWLVEFHPDKCSVIRITRKKIIHRYLYTLHDQILSEETTTKYLGVTIADNMP